jgi:hypothetical protein
MWEWKYSSTILDLHAPASLPPVPTGSGYPVTGPRLAAVNFRIRCHSITALETHLRIITISSWSQFLGTHLRIITISRWSQFLGTHLRIITISRWSQFLWTHLRIITISRWSQFLGTPWGSIVTQTETNVKLSLSLVKHEVCIGEWRYGAIH